MGNDNPEHAAAAGRSPTTLDARARLEEERRRLLARFNGDAGVALRIDEGAQPSEDAYEDVAKDMACTRRESAFLRIQQIAAAIARIDDGTYGACLECGSVVDARRLESDPAAALCVGCQSATETKRRVHTL